MKPRVYIAAPYPVRAAAVLLMLQLERHGIQVTSRWLKAPDELGDEAARKDLDDVQAADVLVAFNPRGWEDQGTGGRHVELGYAVAQGKAVVVIGERSNMFHYLHRVRVLPEDAPVAVVAAAVREEMYRGMPLELTRHLRLQREWSERTFGPGPRTAMVIDHIRKELTEIERDPSDLSEWIDVVILAFDGAWRAGYEPEAIVAALGAKQIKNETRTWPDWRTADPGKAIEHVRTEESHVETVS